MNGLDELVSESMHISSPCKPCFIPSLCWRQIFCQFMLTYLNCIQMCRNLSVHLFFHSLESLLCIRHCADSVLLNCDKPNSTQSKIRKHVTWWQTSQALRVWPCILHKSIPLPICTSQGRGLLIRTFASSIMGFLAPIWNPFGRWSCHKGFKAETYKTEEGRIQMGDEEGMEAECTLVVLSFAGANLTKLAPSLNTSSAVPEPTALFFLHACFMTTSGYANCPQPDLWMCVVFLFARLFQTC